MLKKNTNILSIDFEVSKGLILNWNLNGNLNNCFFRHVLILDVDNNFDYKNFLKKYLQKIKMGDMISIAFINRDE